MVSSGQMLNMRAVFPRVEFAIQAAAEAFAAAGYSTEGLGIEVKTEPFDAVPETITPSIARRKTKKELAKVGLTTAAGTGACRSPFAHFDKGTDTPWPSASGFLSAVKLLGDHVNLLTCARRGTCLTTSACARRGLVDHYVGICKSSMLDSLRHRVCCVAFGLGLSVTWLVLSYAYSEPTNKQRRKYNKCKLCQLHTDFSCDYTDFSCEPSVFDKHDKHGELPVLKFNHSPWQDCELCYMYTREPVCIRCGMLICASCWANWADNTRMPCRCQLTMVTQLDRLFVIRSNFRSKLGGSFVAFRRRTGIEILPEAMPPSGRWANGRVPPAVYQGKVPSTTYLESPTPWDGAMGSQSPVTPEFPAKGIGKSRPLTPEIPGKGDPTKGASRTFQSGDCRNREPSRNRETEDRARRTSGTGKGKASSSHCAPRVSDDGTSTGKGKTSSARSAPRVSDDGPSGCARRIDGSGKGKPSAAGEASAGPSSGSKGCAPRASSSVAEDSQLRPGSQAVPEPSYQLDWRSFGPRGQEGRSANGMQFDKVQAAPLPDTMKGTEVVLRQPLEELESKCKACFNCKWAGRKLKNVEGCPACKAKGPLGENPDYNRRSAWWEIARAGRRRVPVGPVPRYRSTHDHENDDDRAFSAWRKRH